MADPPHLGLCTLWFCLFGALWCKSLVHLWSHLPGSMA